MRPSDPCPVTRPPLPSAGSPRHEFPDFHGTTKGSDPCRPVSPGSCARPAIPPLRRVLRSPPTRRCRGGQGVWGSAPPQPTGRTREGDRSLRFLGSPGACSPGSWTPAGPAHQAVAVYRRGPSVRSDGGLAARSLISGLDSRAFTLTVYASSSGSPRPTQDSFLAAGQLGQVGLATHRAPTKGFQGVLVTSLPPFPSFPDARTRKLSSSLTRERR
jgi:hypothetical protein